MYAFRPTNGIHLAKFIYQSFSFVWFVSRAPALKNTNVDFSSVTICRAQLAHFSIATRGRSGCNLSGDMKRCVNGKSQVVARAAHVCVCVFSQHQHSPSANDVEASIVTTQPPSEGSQQDGRLPAPAVGGTTEAFVEGGTTRHIQHRRRTSRHLEQHYMTDENDNGTLSNLGAFVDEHLPIETGAPVVLPEEDSDENDNAVRRNFRSNAMASFSLCHSTVTFHDRKCHGQRLRPLPPGRCVHGRVMWTRENNKLG
jgi:hypothetical protein